jgi:hypothetical protein
MSIRYAPTGVRLSTQRLIDLVDKDDPAFMYIAGELRDLRRAGEELDEEGVLAAVEAGRVRYAEARRTDGTQGSIVYYVRRSVHIKIGTTGNPMQRFKDLLPEEIIAWEPGGRREEGLRHKQFQHLRIRMKMEYFRPEDELLAHMDEVLSRHGAPDPRWPTLSHLDEEAPGALDPCATDSAELVTLPQAANRLGIRYNTAAVWAYRGKLKQAGANADGHRLFSLADVEALALKGRCSPTST